MTPASVAAETWPSSCAVCGNEFEQHDDRPATEASQVTGSAPGDAPGAGFCTTIATA